MESSGEWSATGVSVGTSIFLVYINDMPEGVSSYINLFADNAKLYRWVKNEDCEILQEDLTKSGGGVRSGRWHLTRKLRHTSYDVASTNCDIHHMMESLF